MIPWLAIDAGGTRLRVARVGAERAAVVGEVWSQPFPDQADRVEFALAALRAVAPPGSFRLALAWAGAPTPDGEGIAWARYGPPLPDLVKRLHSALPLANRPQVMSDARAALQGACRMLEVTEAYGLTSGTGLGEAWCSGGKVWSREQFVERLGRAAELEFAGVDAETALRASAWHQNPQGLSRARRVLAELVALRCRQVDPPPQAVLLGGHFPPSWQAEPGAVPFMPMPQDCALVGAVVLESQRGGSG